MTGVVFRRWRARPGWSSGREQGGKGERPTVRFSGENEEKRDFDQNFEGNSMGGDLISDFIYENVLFTPIISLIIKSPPLFYQDSKECSVVIGGCIVYRVYSI